MKDLKNWTEVYKHTISLKGFKYSFINEKIIPLATEMFGTSLFKRSHGNVNYVQNEDAAFEYYQGFNCDIYFKNIDDAIRFKIVLTTLDQNAL